MLARLVPANGDVVVRQQEREGTLVYVLHTTPGPDQYVLRTREEAVAQAVTFAKGARVRAWLTSGESDIVLLGEFQVPTSKEDGLLTAVRPGSCDEATSQIAMRTMAALARLRSEYKEMPGLRLKSEQVRRLCGIEPKVCQAVLDALVDAKFLEVTSSGHYARLTDGEIRRAHPAKATLRAGQPSLKAS